MPEAESPLTAESAPSDTSSPPRPRRLGSIDAFRGLVMFLLLAEVLELSAVAAANKDVALWQTLAHHQQHVAWVGCSVHDMIQPSFSFLVGVALPFSLLSRSVRGQSKTRIVFHALWRALVLVFLGIFLRSMGKNRPILRLKIPSRKSVSVILFCSCWD